VFPHSNTEVIGSNPTRSMNVCVRLFCVYVVLCEGRILATGWSPDQGVLPTVYRLRHWKRGQGRNRGATTDLRLRTERDSNNPSTLSPNECSLLLVWRTKQN
jgi:hypothetical protein